MAENSTQNTLHHLDICAREQSIDSPDCDALEEKALFSVDGRLSLGCELGLCDELAGGLVEAALVAVVEDV